MRLYIIRHGETNSNLNRIMQGQSDGPQNVLNAKGVEQVSRLASYLENEIEQGKLIIDHFYSSDLGRAMQTAEIINRKLKHKIHLTSQIRERSYGIYEGGSIDTYNQDLLASGLQHHEFRPKLGESPADLEIRMTNFLHDLKSKHMGQTVILVAHAGTNRAILSILLNKNYEERKEFKIDNASLNVLQILDDQQVCVEMLNFLV